MSKIANEAAPINAPTIPTGRIVPLGKPIDSPALRHATEGRVRSLSGESVHPALIPAPTARR